MVLSRRPVTWVLLAVPLECQHPPHLCRHHSGCSNDREAHRDHPVLRIACDSGSEEAAVSHDQQRRRRLKVPEGRCPASCRKHYHRNDDEPRRLLRHVDMVGSLGRLAKELPVSAPSPEPGVLKGLCPVSVAGRTGRRSPAGRGRTGAACSAGRLDRVPAEPCAARSAGTSSTRARSSHNAAWRRTRTSPSGASSPAHSSGRSADEPGATASGRPARTGGKRL